MGADTDPVVSGPSGVGMTSADHRMRYDGWMGYNHDSFITDTSDSFDAGAYVFSSGSFVWSGNQPRAARGIDIALVAATR